MFKKKKKKTQKNDEPKLKYSKNITELRDNKRAVFY